MKKVIIALLILSLLVGMFAACAETLEPEAPDTAAPPRTLEPEENIEPEEEDGWSRVASEWGGFRISIPSTWEFDEFDVGGGTPDSHSIISGDGIEMMISGSPIADPYMVINEFPVQEKFPFDDGHVGYMLENAGQITWFRIDHGRHVISLWHDGDRSLFTDNEQLILRIVSSLERDTDGDLASPRTQVTGLLENGRAVAAISVTLWIDLETGQWLVEDKPIQSLTTEDIARVFEILTTMDAIEVLTPFHYERQSSEPIFTLEIVFADGSIENVFTTEAGAFFVLTDTFGDHGDPGYIMGGFHEELSEILVSYFS